jgi:AcrR family transcriptional regulator
LTDPVGQYRPILVARQIPEGRLGELLEAATRVFIEQGYRRTQMADVAAALGVAKGTVYLYVESKEALFDLACRYADRPPAPGEAPPFPIRTPKAGATLRYVKEELGRQQALSELAAALSRKRVTDARGELAGIVRELYDRLAENRRRIKLLDSSARDYPELAALWFEGARGGYLSLLRDYLESRIARGLLAPVPDLAAAARFVLETAVFWAVHRHFDPRPQRITDELARESVVHLLVRALTKE